MGHGRAWRVLPHLTLSLKLRARGPIRRDPAQPGLPELARRPSYAFVEDRPFAWDPRSQPSNPNLSPPRASESRRRAMERSGIGKRSVSQKRTGRGGVPVQDWPCFRGDPSNSGTTKVSVRLPLRQSWSLDLGGPIESTPAIVGGCAYVATMTGTVLAIRLSDQKTLWRFKSPSAFSSSPTVIGGRVFLGDEGGVFYSLDAATGKPQWRIQTGDKIVSSGAVSGDDIVFGSYDESVYCVRRSDGRRRWTFTTQAQVHGTPAITPYGIVVAGCDGKLRLLRKTTGRQIASFPVGQNVAVSPAVHGQLAAIATIGAAYSMVDLARRKVLWHEAEREEGAGCYASPVFDSGLVLFGSRSRRLFAVDERTGRARWTFRTKETVDSAPVLAAGVALFGCDDGYLYAVRARDGAKLGALRLGGKLTAAPAIGGGLLMIGGEDGNLHALRL